ncbi:hypothetical protein ACE6H2_022862 [Prunus campanulata]
MSPQISSNNWRKPTTTLTSALSFIVFIIPNFLDNFLCILYRYIDELFEGQASSCYCASKEEHVRNVGGHGEVELLETLYQRKMLSG